MDIENFSISISTEKTEYLEGEYIILIVKVKNTGEEADSIQTLDDLSLAQSLAIRNSAGKGSEYIGFDLLIEVKPLINFHQTKKKSFMLT